VGYSAAVLYAVLNAANKTLLFLSTGVHGVLVGAAFAIGAFSVAGIPPAGGFLGKLAMFQVGLAHQSAALVVLIVVGGALSFVYMLRLYQRSFWTDEPSPMPSAWSARATVFTLALVLIGVGVWPEPLLEVSRDAASALARPAP
jgi:multicomponent Na+:H+ antiporter subunit D